jgi:hypothetical protein
MRCWSNVHAVRAPNGSTVRRAAASFGQTGIAVQVGSRQTKLQACVLLHLTDVPISRVVLSADRGRLPLAIVM